MKKYVQICLSCGVLVLDNTVETDLICQLKCYCLFKYHLASRIRLFVHVYRRTVKCYLVRFLKTYYCGFFQSTAYFLFITFSFMSIQ